MSSKGSRYIGGSSWLSYPATTRIEGWNEGLFLEFRSPWISGVGKNMSQTPACSWELLQTLSDLMKPFQQEALFTGWESHQDDIFSWPGIPEKNSNPGVWSSGMGIQSQKKLHVKMIYPKYPCAPIVVIMPRLRENSTILRQISTPGLPLLPYW